MGLFDAILPFGHREMAMSLKKYATSTALTPQERDLVSKLRLESNIFVGERILLLSSFMRACLIHLGDSQGNKLITMVRHFYDIYIEEHFKTLPGVDSGKALGLYAEAGKRYGLVEKEVVYPAFFAHAHAHDAQQRLVADLNPQTYSEFCGLLDSYTQGCISLIKKQLSRINPSEYS